MKEIHIYLAWYLEVIIISLISLSGLIHTGLKKLWMFSYLLLEQDIALLNEPIQIKIFLSSIFFFLCWIKLTRLIKVSLVWINEVSLYLNIFCSFILSIIKDNHSDFFFFCVLQNDEHLRIKKWQMIKIL